MTYEDNVKATRERMLQAERALDAYLHSQRYDAARFQELADELTNARDDFLGVLASLWPGTGTERRE